ncbi:MAG: hypothetical protein HUU20_22155, partial [Pirellulales bacterium]|nr:hypothetical protein [Pirellulales bacterium]
LENVVVATGKFAAWNPGELRNCTTAAGMILGDNNYSAINCITPSIESKIEGARIEYCDVYDAKPFIDMARPGKGCFSAPPQFVDPKSFDFRLLPTSPCRGKASDGGDVGCRYTPEMIEMFTIALELRAKGVIKF